MKITKKHVIAGVAVVGTAAAVALNYRRLMGLFGAVMGFVSIFRGKVG